MNLRVVSLLLVLIGPAFADTVTTRAGTQTGTILKSGSAGVVIKVGDNELTIPVTDVVRVELAKTDAADKAEAAFRAGKLQDAMAGYKAILDRYGWLPVTWVEESYVKLGEIQIALKDPTAAKRTFDAFKAAYPKSTLGPLLDIKYARILLESREADKAVQLVEKTIEPLLKKDALTDDQERAMAEGAMIVGDVQAATGKADDALDQYLKVVTLYDVDNDLTAQARLKAGKIFETAGKWKRAKQTYDDILRETPDVALAGEAKKRFDEISKAHPE
jgi:tetratricopeptide (TPR) repeat protein